MIIELLIFLVIVILLSTIFKVKENFEQQELEGIDWVADKLYPDQLLVELLYDKFETFNYKTSNGKEDQYEAELRDIYYGKLDSRIALFANARVERIGVQLPDFVVYPPFKRSYYGNTQERIVLILEKSKVTKDKLKQFLADITGNKAITGVFEGNISVTGSLAVSNDVTANRVLIGGTNISDKMYSNEIQGNTIKLGSADIRTLFKPINDPEPKPVVFFRYVGNGERGNTSDDDGVMVFPQKDFEGPVQVYFPDKRCFVAPYDGIYQFMASVNNYAEIPGYLDVILRVNEKSWFARECMAIPSPSPLHTVARMTVTGMTSLKKGDRVDVLGLGKEQADPNKKVRLWANWEMQFSGFSIFIF